MRLVLTLVIVFAVISSLIIFSCAASGPFAGPGEDAVINVNNIKANLKFLSSDELEGREAGTRGEKLAAMYIASQLQLYGVKPFAYASRSGKDSLNYFMEFEAQKISVLSTTALVLFDSTNRKQIPLTYGEYFVNLHEQLVDCNIQSPLVFAGFGITAEEFKYDDYAKLDVKNKIVVVLDGEPLSDDDNYFYGAIPSGYSSALFYKRHRAKELGAKGMIVLAYEKLSDQWDDYTTYFKSPRTTFAGAPLPDSGRMPFAYGNNKLFTEILSHGDYSYDSIRARVKEKKELPVFQIRHLSARLTIDLKITNTKAMNIVGVIEGTDSKLKNEFVAIGAHFDHLGVGADGQVFNGADDDGSGTVAVLETARALARSHTNKRSILITFHGAEEKGLLGSEYLTDSDTPKPFELSQIVSQINIDMVGRENADSIFIIGAGRLSRELDSLCEQTNRKLSLFKFDYTFDADSDPNRYYYRSDHYNYAKFGIPVVFFFDGMTADYHKITDDYEKINFPKIEKTARLVYTLASRIANLDHRLKVDRQNQ